MFTEGRKSKRPQPVDSETATPNLMVQRTKTFDDSLAKFKHNQLVIKKLKSFIEFKTQNPRDPFGGKDYPFKGDGPLKGIGHAALTGDVRILYRIHWGNEPPVLQLLMVARHDDIGTGNPPNIKRQKQTYDRISRNP